MVERHGIRYHEKKLGQLFCDGSAAEMVAMLERECAEAGARMVTSCAVREVARSGCFTVETSAGGFEAQSLVVALRRAFDSEDRRRRGSDMTIARQFGLRW